MGPCFLLVEAELFSTGITNEIGSHPDKGDLPLPEELWQQLRNWVNAYDPYLMPRGDLLHHLAAVKRLDEQGLELSSSIRAIRGIDCPVYYESAGLAAYLQDISQFHRLSELYKEIEAEQRANTHRFSAHAPTVFPGLAARNHAHIPDDLWRRVTKWKEHYWPVHCMNVDERLEHLQDLAALDSEGMTLAADMQKVFCGSRMQIIYESMGLGAVMHTMEEFDALAKSLPARSEDILFNFRPWYRLQRKP